MAYRIFSVGQEIPGNVAEYVRFRSDKSMLDADIIIFWPTFNDYYSNDTHAGRPLICDRDSPDLRRDCSHWKSEIKTAVETGKVVFVMLSKPEEVYYDTGERSFSGTGRGRVTQRHVASANSYDSLPLTFEGLIPRGGTEISVLGELGPLAVYWHEFRSESSYEVYFNSKGFESLLGTKKREKVVGGIIRTKSGGSLVLLPPVKIYQEGFTFSRGKSTFWSKDGVAFGNRLIASLVATSDVLRKEGKRTPVPEWANDVEYRLKAEDQLRREIDQVDGKMKDLVEIRKELQVKVSDVGELRALLYETGKPLEATVLKALRLLGFRAEPYKEADSEFDAVFLSPEGRFLGEVEGKDSKSINIDKMSQLERNLHEDFAREGVTDFAKGVLFGNAFRLDPPAKRGQFFTEKCVTAAKRLQIALIRTPDLFVPARYLFENEDDAYAKACRESIFRTTGEIVVFPDPSV